MVGQAEGAEGFLVKAGVAVELTPPIRRLTGRQLRCNR